MKTDNMLWWASLLMFIGAMGFNISNIAGVLYGDVPLNLSTSQEVGSLFPGLHALPVSLPLPHDCDCHLSM